MGPSSDVLNRLAGALEQSPDYLMNGTLKEKAINGLMDEELLKQFKKIEQMPEAKKKLLLEFIEAFVFKTDLQQKLAS